MRLRWPFGRAERTDDPPARIPVDFDGSIRRTAPARREWAQLPPIQRAVGDAPLVASTTRFQADAVAGSHALPPILEALGHEVHPSAPAGLVTAAPVAVPALTSDRPLVDRPVQRRTEHRDLAASDLEADPPTATSGAHPGSGVQQPAPVRHLDVVPAQRPTPVPERPLTRALPVPQSPRATLRRSTADGPTTSSSPAGAFGAPPSALPGLPSASGSLPPPANRPRFRTAHDTAATAPAASAFTATRRSGLGAPLVTPSPAGTPDAVPSIGTDQRSVAAPTAMASGPGQPLGLASRPRIRPIAQRSAADAAAPAAATGGPPLEGASPVAGRPRLPELPVVRPGHGPSPGSEPVAAGSSPFDTTIRGSTPPPVQRAVTSPPSPASGRPSNALAIRPVLGRRPLRPLAANADEGAATLDSGTGGTSGRPSRVPTEPRGPSRVAAPTLQRDALPAVTASQAEAGPYPDLAAASSSRRGPAISDGPAAFTSLPGATARRTTAATSPTSAVQRTADTAVLDALPLARPAPPPPPGAAPSVGGMPEGAMRTVVFPGAERLASATAGGPASPSVQRSAGSGGGGFGPSSTRHVEAPAVQRVDGSVSPVPGEGDEAGEQSEEELERLAGALYGRIRAQLRSELIHDREARGLTFDNA